MRDIKFRGLDIKGSWYYGLLAERKKKVDHIEVGFYISNPIGMPHAYQVRPETVTQFTGLHDKNGEEIYEGDIVEFSDKWEWYKSKYWVSLKFAQDKEDNPWYIIPKYRIAEKSPEEAVARLWLILNTNDDE